MPAKKSLTAGSTGNYGTQTTLTGNTASISVTTEGADLSGYVGIPSNISCCAIS